MLLQNAVIATVISLFEILALCAKTVKHQTYLSHLQAHRRNNRGDRGRLVPPTFRLGGTNNVLVPLNFLAVVFKKQEISQEVLLLLNETQSFHYQLLRTPQTF